jgi:predicted Ser/Thr protein kinase
MATCKQCRHENSNDAEKCVECGAEIQSTNAHAISLDPQLLVGRVLNGKYKVLSVLGEGGMGVVYKVRHLILEKRNLFALKILHPRFSNDDRFRRRFLREVELAMELTHENVIQIREFGLTEDELLFFTMDYFDGQPLSRVIQEQRPFAPGRIIHVARSLVFALAEAHKAGIVHRDLKPDNVLVSPSPEGDRVRILDFGIAKAIEADGQSSTLTQGGVIGTPKYMSPEQASGEDVDGRSDLYSLGVLLYEIVAGRVPFAKGNARTILLAHLTTPPPPFRESAPDVQVSPRLESFIFSLLSKDRSERPASAETCLALLEDRPVAAPASPTLTIPLAPVLRPPSRRRATLAIVASVVAVLLGAGVIVWTGALQRNAAFGAAALERDVRSETVTATRTYEASAGAAADASDPSAPSPGLQSNGGSRAASGRAAPSGAAGDRGGVPSRFACIVCDNGKRFEDRQVYLNRCPDCGELMTSVQPNSEGTPSSREERGESSRARAQSLPQPHKLRSELQRLQGELRRDREEP